MTPITEAWLGKAKVSRRKKAGGEPCMWRMASPVSSEQPLLVMKAVR